MSVGSKLAQEIIRRRSKALYAAMDKYAFVKSALAPASHNRSFRGRNPEFEVPPLYLLWDAQSYTDYEKYKNSGEQAATLYWQLIREHVDSQSVTVRRVCEWGCGPGRIIRHLPGLSHDDPPYEFFGTDYNSSSIEWCQRCLKNVTFKSNRLTPPLDFKDGFFDIFFCRSVLTHLSEELHHVWIRELSRVVKVGGVFILSTQGNAHRERLMPEERDRFDRGELVVRGLAEEGRLNFSAFHPSRFVREQLLSGFLILEHREGRAAQDIWIVRNTR
jgi:SAM-dependent methyltransferase